VGDATKVDISKATGRPWRVGPVVEGEPGPHGGTRCIMADIDGDPVDVAYVQPSADEVDTHTAAERDANTALIVAAVNDYDALAAQRDALVAVLQEWVTYFDRLDRDAEPDDPMVKVRQQVHGARVARTRAALAAARPQ
jgi:hypothetical protein